MLQRSGTTQGQRSHELLAVKRGLKRDEERHFQTSIPLEKAYSFSNQLHKKICPDRYR